jgi:purine-binding chemotaxis protein CheW
MTQHAAATLDGSGQAVAGRLGAGGDSVAGQYVTFMCAGTEYGVPIVDVQEIKGWEPVTRIPCTPHYLLGVMNLRGTVVPVIDLRRVLGHDAQPFDAATAVVLVHARVSAAATIVGLVVDAVSEVYNIAAEAIRPAPDVGGGCDEIALRGIAAIDGKMILLIDADPLVGAIAGTTRARIASDEAADRDERRTPGAPLGDPLLRISQ